MPQRLTMVTKAPTSGGHYHWVSMLAPPSSQKFLSYVTGRHIQELILLTTVDLQNLAWLMVVGWQASAASLGYISGTIIQGLISMNNPNYIFERWHGTLLFWACTLFAMSVNTFVGHFLPAIERVILVLHLFGFFIVLVPMVFLGPHGSSADVFTRFLNRGGWSTQGLSFFVGLSGNVFSLAGTLNASIRFCSCCD